MTIPCRGWRPIESCLLLSIGGWIAGCRSRLDHFALQAYIRAIAASSSHWGCIDLDHVPAELNHLVGLIGQTVTFFTLHGWLSRYERLHLLFHSVSFEPTLIVGKIPLIN